MAPLIPLRCTSCGGTLPSTGGDALVCPYCGATYRLGDTRDERADSDAVLAAAIETLNRETGDPDRAGETSPKCKSAIEVLERMRSPTDYRLANPAAVAALVEAARRRNGLALNALRTLPGDDGANALAGLAETSDELVADSALVYFKSSCSNVSMEVFYNGLKSSNAKVREFSASHLGVRNKRAQDALAASLADDSYRVRIECANVLARVGGKNSIPALVQAWRSAANDPLGDGDSPVDDTDRGYPGYYPQLLMLTVLDALEKLAPDEFNRLIEAARQDRSLSKVARNLVQSSRFGTMKKRSWW